MFKTLALATVTTLSAAAPVIFFDEPLADGKDIIGVRVNNVFMTDTG